jgi:hypothetical protein
VVPSWFILDNNDTDKNVLFTTGQDSMRAKHMLRDPRVGLCVDDQAPPLECNNRTEIVYDNVGFDTAWLVSSNITLSAASRK